MSSLKKKLSYAAFKLRGSRTDSCEVKRKFFHVDCEDNDIVRTYCRNAEVAVQRLEEIWHFSWNYQVEFCIEILRRAGGTLSAGEKEALEVYKNR